ncbi:MAG: hypothetical protein ACR2H4_00875 [Pyrinomonadaceae bacterium]
MNFSSASVKPKSTLQNEHFYFHLETASGHLFVVLDFDPHNYANLNSTLTGKLETIVGTLTSLSNIPAELLLGFLTKEINNFLHNLGEQSGGPELLCSAALCLVSGKRLFYFLCGEITINILTGDRPLALHGAESDLPGEKPRHWEFEHLGAHHQEGPLTDGVQVLTLGDEDTVLIMTHSLEEAFDGQQLDNEIRSLRSSDSKMICDMLMQAGASSQDERTLVVISGPYVRHVDPMLSDLSKTVASLLMRANPLADSDEPRDSVASLMEKDLSSEIQMEQKFRQQIEMLRHELIEMLRDDFRAKASNSDVMELDDKLENLSIVLASKADTAEVLRLQGEVLERIASLVELVNSVSASPKKRRAKRAKVSTARKTARKGKSIRPTTKTAAKKSGKANEGLTARASENKTALRASSKKQRRRASIKRSKSR